VQIDRIDQRQFFIGGDFVRPRGDDRIEVINPATEEARVAAGGPPGLDRGFYVAPTVFQRLHPRPFLITE
jgi:acyl-CoA reductase-like NAD-dependent aldehyde dehydrogenase